MMEALDLSKISAIIVEDDAGGMAIITTFLRRLGITTYQDKYGDHTLALLSEITPLPAVVFLDLKLPNRTGFDLLNEIRRNPRFDSVKVVAVTAMDATIMLQKCREAGFDGYIAKPLRRERFKSQVERILNGEAVWDPD